MCISTHRIQILSLLDSDSVVTLLGSPTLRNTYCQKIKLPMGEKANAHSIFRLKVTNDGQMPITMYIKCGFTFLELKVLNVGMLITEELNQVLDKEH